MKKFSLIHKKLQDKAKSQHFKQQQNQSTSSKAVKYH